MLASSDIWVGSSVLSGVCMFVALLAYRRDSQASARAIKQRNDTIAELARNTGNLHSALKEQQQKREAAEREREQIAQQRDAMERDLAVAEHERDELDRRWAEAEHHHQSIEREIEDRDSQLRAIIDTIDAVCFAVDRAGRWTYLSPAWESMTGWSIGDSIGREAVDYIAPDDRADWLEFQRTLLAGEHDSGDGLARLVGADGGVHWVEVRTRHLLDQLGEVAGFTGSLADVTKRVRAERGLQRQQALSRLLAESSSDVLILVSREGRITYVSPAAQEVLGYAPKELIALDPVTLVDAEQRERAADAIRAAAAGTMPHECLRVRHRDGRWLWLDIAVSTVADPMTGAASYRVVARDVTESRAASEAFAEIEARYRALAATVIDHDAVGHVERMAAAAFSVSRIAGELAPSLAAISGHARMLLGHPDSAQASDGALATILRETERATRLVRRLRLVSYGDGSRARTRVELNELVRACVDEQLDEARASGVAWRLELCDEPPYILADPDQMEHAMRQLLLHARRTLRAPDGVSLPTLTVRTAVRAGEVVLSIEDNGPALPAAELLRIWDPFWTDGSGDAASRSAPSLVHGIVRAHGGSINASSLAGDGTSFTIALPQLTGLVSGEWPVAAD